MTASTSKRWRLTNVSSRPRHRFADFTRSQLLHGLLQLVCRVWLHVNVPRDGSIAFQVQRNCVASSRRGQALEESVEVVGNTRVIAIDVHLSLLRRDFSLQVPRD